MENPYQSPAVAGGNGEAGNSAKAERPRAGRVFASALLLLAGACFILLLNGQAFTNAIFFIACAFTSLLIWLHSFITAGHGRTVVLIAIVIHLVVIAGVVASLPDRFAWQQKFNAAMQKAKAQGPWVDRIISVPSRDHLQTPTAGSNGSRQLDELKFRSGSASRTYRQGY